MRKLRDWNERPGAVFILCLLYALHMAEEFSCGFVAWADRYFGSFDWTQNLLGNAGFFAVLTLACFLYYKNPVKHLWLGMSAAMWVLSNAFLHISATVLSGEYSPGVVTAALLYIPGGVCFMAMQGRKRLLTWKNMGLSCAVGAMVFMLIPALIRSVYFHAELAKVLHLVR